VEINWRFSARDCRENLLSLQLHYGQGEREYKRADEDTDDAERFRPTEQGRENQQSVDLDMCTEHLRSDQHVDLTDDCRALERNSYAG